jgi:hypothetical protein
MKLKGNRIILVASDILSLLCFWPIALERLNKLYSSNTISALTRIVILLPLASCWDLHLNTENPLGTIASIEYTLRRLDRDAEEEKSKGERIEKALADYRE